MLYVGIRHFNFIVVAMQQSSSQKIPESVETKEREWRDYTDLLGSFIAAFSEIESHLLAQNLERSHYSTSSEVNGEVAIYFICIKIKFTTPVPP